MLFVCENNGYAIHEPIAKRWAVRDLVANGEGLTGFPPAAIERRRRPGDPREATAAAVEPMRAGAAAPVFIECHDLSLARARRAGRGLRCRLPRPDRARAVAGDRPGGRLAGMIAPRRAPQDRGGGRAATSRDAFAFAEAARSRMPSELSTHVFS